MQSFWLVIHSSGARRIYFERIASDDILLGPRSKTVVAPFLMYIPTKILASSFVREAAIVKFSKDRITNVALGADLFQPASIL